MSYSEKIECHGDVSQGVFRFGDPVWKVREADGAYGINKRHCSYCGSLHPEDLLEVLEQGARLELADMKYGWPHKFYVSGVINPRAGEVVKMGSESGPVKDEEGKIVRNEDGSVKRYENAIMSPAPQTLQKKFYNVHLLDLKGTPEFDLVSDAIAKHSGLRFFFKEDGNLYCQRA